MRSRCKDGCIKRAHEAEVILGGEREDVGGSVGGCLGRVSRGTLPSSRCLIPRQHRFPLSSAATTKEGGAGQRNCHCRSPHMEVSSFRAGQPIASPERGLRAAPTPVRAAKGIHDHPRALVTHKVPSVCLQRRSVVYHGADKTVRGARGRGRTRRLGRLCRTP